VKKYLGDWGVLYYNKSGQIIKWDYFEELVCIKNKAGFHCRTKIRSRHIRYEKEKIHSISVRGGM